VVRIRMAVSTPTPPTRGFPFPSLPFPSEESSVPENESALPQLFFLFLHCYFITTDNDLKLDIRFVLPRQLILCVRMPLLIMPGNPTLASLCPIARSLAHSLTHAFDTSRHYIPTQVPIHPFRRPWRRHRRHTHARN